MFTDLVTGDGRVVEYFSRIGDGGFVPYNTGPQLVAIFNELGFTDEYNESFGTRWYYAHNRLTTLNEHNRIDTFIKHYLHPQNLLEWNSQNVEKIIGIVNNYLQLDGFRVALLDTSIRVEETNISIVKAEDIEKIDNDLIHEQIQKCENRIVQGDFSGAITSARSLLESVLKYIHKELFQAEAGNKDLPALYKKVTKKLRIHNISKVDNGLQKIAGGLNAAVVGLSEVRNKSSDSHGETDLKYRVNRHHALLVVNAAKTIAQFLLQSYKKQYDE